MLDRAGWTYALVVIVLTIAIHTTGLVSIGLIRPRVRSLLLKKDPTTWRWGVFLTCHIAAAGLALVVLHAVESALWAVAYLRAGAVDSISDWTQFPGDHAGATDAGGEHSKPAARQQP